MSLWYILCLTQRYLSVYYSGIQNLLAALDKGVFRPVYWYWATSHVHIRVWVFPMVLCHGWSCPTRKKKDGGMDHVTFHYPSAQISDDPSCPRSLLVTQHKVVSVEYLTCGIFLPTLSEAVLLIYGPQGSNVHPEKPTNLRRVSKKQSFNGSLRPIN